MTKTKLKDTKVGSWLNPEVSLLFGDRSVIICLTL